MKAESQESSVLAFHLGPLEECQDACDARPDCVGLYALAGPPHRCLLFNASYTAAAGSTSESIWTKKDASCVRPESGTHPTSVHIMAPFPPADPWRRVRVGAAGGVGLRRNAPGHRRIILHPHLHPAVLEHLRLHCFYQNHSLRLGNLRCSK